MLVISQRHSGISLKERQPERSTLSRSDLQTILHTDKCTKHHLRNPEPNLLNDVPWNQLRPIAVLGIQCGFSALDISIGWVNPLGTLEDLPEKEHEDVDWYTDIGGKEVANIPVRVVLANEDVESGKDDDQAKEDQSEPCSVWLESGLEDQGVTVDSLILECLVELDVGNADGDPGPEGSDGNNVLEPGESLGGTTFSDGKVSKTCDGGSDGDSIIWNTVLVAGEEDSWCLSVLGQGKEITGTSVQESVGG